MATTRKSTLYSFGIATRIEPQVFLEQYEIEDVENLANYIRDRWIRFNPKENPPSWDLFMEQADWYLRNKVMGKSDILGNGKLEWVSHEENWQLAKNKYPKEYKMLFVDWSLE
jgi:hypothetical protein